MLASAFLNSGLRSTVGVAAVAARSTAAAARHWKWLSTTHDRQYATYPRKGRPPASRDRRQGNDERQSTRSGKRATSFSSDAEPRPRVTRARAGARPQAETRPAASHNKKTTKSATEQRTLDSAEKPKPDNEECIVIKVPREFHHWPLRRFLTNGLPTLGYTASSPRLYKNFVVCHPLCDCGVVRRLGWRLSS